MTRTEFALAYAKCTDAELQSFIVNRRLQINIPWTTRKAVIRALRNADLEVTFRFLDLPAEMRNLVYCELLRLRPKGGYSTGKWCWPSINAVCHQVHKETEGILHDGSTAISVLFSNYTAHGHYYYPHLAINHRSVEFDEEWEVRETSLKWPEHLAKRQNLRLVVKIYDHPGHPGWARFAGSLVMINRALYDLLNFLIRGGNLTELDIDITCNHPTFDGRYVELFEILSLFPGTKRLTTHNFQAAVSTVILRPAPLSMTKAEDLLQKYRTLHAKAQEYLVLHDAPDRQRSDLIKQYLDTSAVTLGFDNMVSVARHQELKRCLGHLEVELEDTMELSMANRE